MLLLFFEGLFLSIDEMLNVQLLEPNNNKKQWNWESKVTVQSIQKFPGKLDEQQSKISIIQQLWCSAACSMGVLSLTLPSLAGFPAESGVWSWFQFDRRSPRFWPLSSDRSRRDRPPTWSGLCVAWAPVFRTAEVVTPLPRVHLSSSEWLRINTGTHTPSDRWLLSDPLTSSKEQLVLLMGAGTSPCSARVSLRL